MHDRSGACREQPTDDADRWKSGLDQPTLTPTLWKTAHLPLVSFGSKRHRNMVWRHLLRDTCDSRFREVPMERSCIGAVLGKRCHTCHRTASDSCVPPGGVSIAC